MGLGRIWASLGIGLAAFAAVTATVYLSPLRVPVSALAGRKAPLLKREMQSEFLGLQQREQQIAAAPDKASSELKTAQETDWREYTESRRRLGDWIQSQSHPTLSGFGLWAGDLWIWLAALGIGFPAMGVVAARSFGRNGGASVRSHPATVNARKAEMMSQLQTAARRIGEIAKPAEAASPSVPFPPTAHPPIPPATPPEDLFQAPGAALPEQHHPGKMDIEYLESETLYQPPAFASTDPPETDLVWSPKALTMEDESERPAAETPGDDSADETLLGKMPETTEFEQLERQREEVLRYARKGMTPSEIARRLRMSQDQVDLIIRIRRERG